MALSLKLLQQVSWSNNSTTPGVPYSSFTIEKTGYTRSLGFRRRLKIELCFIEKLRTLAFNASVCKFTKAYIEQHQNDFCDLVRSTTWKAPQGELRSIAPKEAIFSYVHQAITLWNDGGEMGHLEQAYDVIMSSVGRTNWEEIQGTNDEGNWKLLQLMIEGNDNFDIREASEASRACQALWPVPADGPGSILPEALCQLARGLRAGAMLNTPIDESFYRAFITLFCAEHTAGRAQGEALHGAIQTAYYLASASVGQPLDTQEQRSTSRATDPGLLERIIHLKRAQLQSIKQLRAAEREVVMELGGTVTEIVPPNQLIQEIRSTMDINHCRELAVKLFKMSFMRHDLFAQSMVTQAATELSLLKAFWVPDDDYEDDGEGEDEDDDEAMPDASEMDEDA
ncbi:uncharacterized protein NECHADRAFT_79181 [Fusarium vanettenii 77-13-4]|uniref:Uncharacterized protein n=1 Tax=Fusarium vanettenii (strain ATCC MYA-4622 / CBS 123669 / FGSC 9596 / NRRL 45880 / 77-13-4) TaxID=660122 RepID=C7YQP9_FUSV7|nr:uncharacterized protein NECHADRAFT_79181 [Fusarium vanettenii 77-13-4]EEU46060.1 predicted protein [Fusarium vanettenii 77-13-4]